MARTAIGLRPLTRSERATLERKLRELSLPARLHRRYAVVEQVRRGCSVPEAASRTGTNLQTAYDWVHRFNASGFRSFEAVSNPVGRLVNGG